MRTGRTPRPGTPSIERPAQRIASIRMRIRSASRRPLEARAGSELADRSNRSRHPPSHRLKPPSPSASAPRTPRPTRSPPGSSSASSSICWRSICRRTANTPASSSSWTGRTSPRGLPVTNGMMANKLQFGAMGDYPLVVNGFTFENNPESKSRLIAVAAYSLQGSGNGLVVHKDLALLRTLRSQGQAGQRTVRLGRPRHDAEGDAGPRLGRRLLPAGQPEPGGRLDQSAGKKIDAHADFVPFAELLPFRGFARKIFDGVETNLPTWHGVVVRTDFAEKYPGDRRRLHQGGHRRQ